VAALGAVVSLSADADFQGRAGVQTGPPDQRVSSQYNQREDEALVKHIGALVGQLTPEAEKTFQAWELAVNGWRKEPQSGAEAALAAGVLFDCLTRLRDVWPPSLSDHKDILVWSIPDKRVKQAAEALKTAADLDGTLVEARFRFDRIRGAKDRAAVSDLERLAMAPAEPPYGYLAAVSRAEVALGSGDSVGAERWYSRAIALFPDSTAARIALGALGSRGEAPRESTNHADPYYDYPCRVMTPAVANALAARIRASVSK